MLVVYFQHDAATHEPKNNILIYLFQSISYGPMESMANEGGCLF